MFDYLPERLRKIIPPSRVAGVSELRFYENKPPVIVSADGKISFSGGVITREDLLKIVYSACKRSVYSFEEQIKRGFITTDDGERIGLGGEFVYGNDGVTAIKNFSSLCIRVPHFVKDVAKPFYERYDGGSVLVFSRAGDGKTTFIRDLVRLISDGGKFCVIVDERNEIAAKCGSSSFDSGKFTDVLTFADKSFGFSQALRTLCPQVIVTDELMSVSDADGVLSAQKGGVDVIATVHARSLTELKEKDYLKSLNGVFKYFIGICNFENGGRRYSVYDACGKILWNF